MQAIILAAGMGKRLGKYTKSNTKCMVEVNGKRLIDRTLTELSKIGVRRTVIVIGYYGKELKEYVGNSYNGMCIEYVVNNIYDKTNNIYSLFLAKDKLAEDDTLLLESDIIFESSILEKAANSNYKDLAVVAKYESWMDGTVVKVDSDNSIINFIPKKAFNYSERNCYYKTVNIYKFSKEFSCSTYIPFLEAYSKALGNNEYYEQVLRVITLLDGCNLKALSVDNDKWYEIDNLQDLRIAENIFAESEDKLKLTYKRYGGFWRFPQLLDFCYLVNPYFPTQRMLEEIKSDFNILVREYPSGAQVNNALASMIFKIEEDKIVVGNGAAELINILMNILKGRMGNISPTFEEYPNRKNKEDVITFYPQKEGYTYNANDIINFFNDKEIKSLLLINPDNPSGNIIDKKGVIELISWAKQKDIRIIIDESFMDFANDSNNNSIFNDDILENNTNLIVIKSISKSYGIPGLRLGVLATNDKTIITEIKKEISIWNINSFAEYFLQIFSKYDKDYTEGCNKIINERERMYDLLSEIPFLKVYPSQANYFLCKVTNKYTSTNLAMLMLCKYNILIKDCSKKKGFEGKNFIRISVRNSNDNNKLIGILKSLI